MAALGSASNQELIQQDHSLPVEKKTWQHWGQHPIKSLFNKITHKL
jgi:hypothetical protein